MYMGVYSNFPSNAVRIISGNLFLTRVMTIFIKHVFFAKVGKVKESDPLSSDPLSSDPLSSNPLSSDPLSSDPLSSDIETILLKAGTKRVHKYKGGTKRYKSGTKTEQRLYKSYVQNDKRGFH